jgi:N-acetylglutamate synthase/N-acetylornithine aminotransferase
MAKSTSIVGAASFLATEKKVQRSALNVGDLYKETNSGRVLMHTGQRTMPPSGRRVEVRVGDQVVVHEVFPSLGRNAVGQDIIAFQSIVVQGDVAPGQDGAVVSFKDGEVTLVGKATINPAYFR